MPYMKFIYAALIIYCYIWNKPTSNLKLIIYKKQSKKWRFSDFRFNLASEKSCLASKANLCRM